MRQRRRFNRRNEWYTLLTRKTVNAHPKLFKAEDIGWYLIRQQFAGFAVGDIVPIEDITEMKQAMGSRWPVQYR